MSTTRSEKDKLACIIISVLQILSNMNYHFIIILNDLRTVSCNCMHANNHWQFQDFLRKVTSFVSFFKVMKLSTGTALILNWFGCNMFTLQHVCMQHNKLAMARLLRKITSFVSFLKVKKLTYMVHEYSFKQIQGATYLHYKYNIIKFL